MSDEIRDVHRRRLIGGVAAIGGAMPLLAACGSDESSNGAEEGSGGSGSGGGDGEAGAYEVEASEVPVGSGRIFREGLEGGEEIVVTQPKKGQFKAFSAICTHNQCVVSKVDDSAIICTCHQSHYDLSTGEVTGGPAPEPLPEKSVQVDNGTVRVS